MAILYPYYIGGYGGWQCRDPADCGLGDDCPYPDDCKAVECHCAPGQKCFKPCAPTGTDFGETD